MRHVYRLLVGAVLFWLMYMAIQMNVDWVVRAGSVLLVLVWCAFMLMYSEEEAKLLVIMKGSKDESK